MEGNLIDNVIMFLNSAEAVYKIKDYTSATTLYFKAVFVAMDYLCLKALGKSPKDHTERFRMLEQNFPDLYIFLDENFEIYRKTYSLIISKDICEKVREDVNKIIKKYKVQK